MVSVRIVDYFSLKDAFYTERAESLFYSPAWVRVLHKTYGFQCLAAIDEEKNICIPLVLVDNLMGKKLVSLPFSDYTDIHAGSPEKYADIIAKIEAEFPDVPLTLKTIGPTGASDSALWGEPGRRAYYHRIANRCRYENPEVPIQLL